MYSMAYLKMPKVSQIELELWYFPYLLLLLAKGVMLDDHWQSLAGNYYPKTEKMRIEKLKQDYLESHPQVGLLHG
jgi:cytochrome c-type biogenesis protein CcmH/NrfF